MTQQHSNSKLGFVTTFQKSILALGATLIGAFIWLNYRTVQGQGSQKVAGEYRSSWTALTDTQAAYLQLDTSGRLRIVCENGCTQAIVPAPDFSYKHISTNTCTVISSAPVFLHTLVTNTAGTLENMTIYDNGACSGTVIASKSTLVASDAGTTFDLNTLNGLSINTSGTLAADITVSYQ